MQRTFIKIGVRSSNLALAMAFEVKQIILQKIQNFPIDVKIEAMSTKGDRILNKSLAAIGGKGLFTEEIEKALLNNNIDIAVHSAKDMPSFLPDKLHLAGYIKRGRIEDCFVSRNNVSFVNLPKGAVIGTSSLRRHALIKKYRPDLEIKLLRGNVETRLAKVANGEIDGTFLALCGMDRLGLSDRVTEVMDVDFFPPAPAQGCICIEAREFDNEMNQLLDLISDQGTAVELSAEREFLQVLDGNCRTPICAYSRFKENHFHFFAMILSKDGKKTYQLTKKLAFSSDKSQIEQAKTLGRDVAIELKNLAGDEFFRDWGL